MNERLPNSLFKFCLHFFKKWPVSFTIFFLAPFLVILESNVIPYAFFKMLIDVMSEHAQNKQQIFYYAIPALTLGGSAWFAQMILLRLQNWWQGYIIPQFQSDMRLTILKHITQHSYQYYSNNLSGDIANKVNELVRAIENIRLILTWNILATSIVTLGAIVIMMTINIKYSFIILTWVVANVVLLILRVDRVNYAALKNAEDKSKLSGVLVDIIGNIKSIKLFSLQNYEIQYAADKQKSEQISHKNLISETNKYWLNIDIPISLVLGILIYCLLTDWQKGLISNGDFVFIFNSAFIIMNQLWHLGWSLKDFIKDIGIARQALQLITVPHDIVDQKNASILEVKQGRIEFKDVTFHYRNGTKIFNNKNIIIYPSQKVGLVGFSGSGKTTFANLILRLFDVESGMITIDGVNIASVTQESLRRNIAMIPQDTTLFHRTLYENISYGNPHASYNEVINASKMAHCDEFIIQQSSGYDTMVGERGVKLSGGQRQRIAIARAMLKNAPIIILDEATSALDSLTEQLIQDSLECIMANRTTIVIAHRLSTLLTMDRILVFDNGRIIEDGSHKELLEQCGYYADLWNRQTGGFLPE